MSTHVDFTYEENNPMNPPKETATPRTDAECYKSARYDEEEIPGFDYVEADFARQLETELSAALAEVEKLSARLAWLNTVEGMDWFGHLDYGDLTIEAIDAAIEKEKKG